MTEREISTITVSGKNIREAHTHYEVMTHVGPYAATIIIPGYIAEAFLLKYNLRIQNAACLVIQTSFVQNDTLVDECRNAFQSDSHLRATIQSLDEISFEKKI